MKKLLSLLMVFVFLQVQTWALSGGPQYGYQGSNVTIGTYGGVFIPITVVGAPPAASAASIGLFSIGVPDVGLAEGTVAIFVNGGAYVGKIVANVDPENSLLQGIISAESTFDITLVVATNPPTTVTYNLVAQGNIVAEFEKTSRGAGTGGQGTRLVGTAQVDTFGDIDANGSPIISSSTNFSVNGLKQSSEVAPSDIDLQP